MPATRDELERWIVETRHTRRTLALACASGVAVALALLVWRTAVGGVALVIVALVALCGFWITSSHILDFQTKLHELDHPRPKQVNRGIYGR